MKKIAFFLSMLMLLTISTNSVWATEVTWSGTTALPGTFTAIGNDANVKIKVSTTNTYSNPIRVYANTTISIQAAEGYTIESVTYEASSTGNYVTYAQNATVSPSVTPSVSGKSVTWSFNSNTSEFTFAPSAQTRSNGITVVYSTAGGGSTPSLTASPTTIDFGTVEQGSSVAAKKVAVTFANLTGSVTYSGLSGAFAATGTISASGDEITITPSTATVGIYNQTLTIQSSADSKSQDVTVTMNVVEPFDGLKLTFDFVTHPTGWPTVKTEAAQGNYYYAINSQSYTFLHTKNGDGIYCGGTSGTSGYLMMSSGNSLGLPAISDYKLVRVDGTLNNSGNPSTASSVAIIDDENNVINGGTAQTWDTKGGEKTYNLSETDVNTVYYLSVSNKNCQMIELVLYYEEVEAPAIEKPIIAGETPFLTSTTVTLTQADADHIYYTTNGDAPTTSSTEYNASFELNATTTVKAIAVKGSDVSDVAEKTFTKVTVMTVPEAKAAIDAGGDLTNKYVAGTISQIDSYNSTYNSITYWISDDGTTTNQLQVYSGLAGVVKSAFASENDLAVGDDVTVKGTLKKYSSTYEFDKNNTIEAYKPIARLAWSAESFNASLEGANTFPTLTNTNGVSVSYSSSDESAATINSSTGAISLVAVGSTTITASFAGNETYKAKSVSYTLNVASSLVTLTYNVDGGEAIDPVNVSALPNPLPTTTKAGKNFGGWFTDANKTVAAVAGAAITENTTLYAKWLDPYTVADAKAVIDGLNGGTKDNQYVAGIISQIDSYSSQYHSITYWISADGTTTNQLEVYSGKGLNSAHFSAVTDLELGDEVVVTGTLKKYNDVYEFDKNNYLYSLSRKASAGLEYAVTAVNKAVDDDAFINPLTNPNSVDVTYATSDDQVAEVANDGTVTIIGEGSATITASFTGNETYSAAQVSYTLTVSATPVVLTDYYEKVTTTEGITEGTYLIVYESENVAFNGSLETFDAANNTISVEITNDKKIGVTEQTAAATFTIDVTAGTIKSASGYYIGITSYGNGLKSSTSDAYVHQNISIDGGNAVIYFQQESWNSNKNGKMQLCYNSDSNSKRFRYYKEGSQKAIQLYKLHGEVIKPAAGLAWDPADDIVLTVGDEFTAPTLLNPNNIATADITIASDNEDLATVSNGVVSLVADATGTATITATFAGNNNYQAGSASYTITVNAAASPASGATYSKVTSTLDITDGEYLIVYEATSVAFNGALETLDAAGNTVDVVISEGKIAGNAAIDAAVFTIDVTAGTLQSASGKYIGVSSNSNGLKQTEDATTYTHIFSIDDDENAVILANFEGSTMKLRYNPFTSAGNLRFRYYKNDGQQAIQLYKKESAEPVEPDYTEIRTGLTAGSWGTFCYNQDVEHPTGASFFTIAYVGMENGVPYKVFFDEIGEGESLQAGKPYVYIANDDAIKGIPSGDPVAEGSNDHGFIGVLSDFTFQVSDAASQNKYYVIYDNQIRLCDDGWFKLLAGRAYIDIKDPNLPTQGTASPAPGRRRISLSNPEAPQTATSINAIESNGKTVKVMIGEQLFILRDGKLYDTTGRLVK